MKCLLLAAGLGTRLRPITDHIPKCLVKVNGVTLLDRWLMSLHKAGVAEFLINTHYLADQVRGFLEGHPLRDSIKVVHEETLRGTGGTLLANSTFFKGGATLVAHADNLCLCDWPAFFEAHMGRPADAIVTMMTFVTDSPSECGIVETDRAGRPCKFHEKSANPPGNIANAAVYIFEPEVVSIAQQMKPLLTDISTQLLPAVLSQTHLWRNEGVLIDIGT
ncbi:MAG: nucleotidyltransferase family protein, partial [Fimbriimonadaceae bacterium]